MAFRPRCPNSLYNLVEKNRITAEINQANSKAINAFGMLSGFFSVNKIKVARIDGPAINGTANGTINGSPSSSSSSLITPPRVGKIIRIAIIIITKPPPIATASVLSPKVCKILPPANKNNIINNSAISNSLIIINLRLPSGTLFNTDKKIGILPKGSIIKNKVSAVA